MNELLLKEALAALARGWALTPLAGKKPILDAWQDRQMPTPAQVREWAAWGHNLGLRTGPVSGVLVIDHDPRHDDGTPLPALPRTVMVNTGGGGTHRYYRCPADPPPNSSRRLHPAIDVKSLRGQVVFVGSVHPDTGRRYTWAPGLDPESVPLAELPLEPLGRMRPQPAVVTRPPVNALPGEQRLRRASAYLARVPGGISGEGGSRPCFRAACVLVHGFGLAQEEALALLVDEYSPRCTPPWSERELRHKVADAARQPGVHGFVMEARRGAPAWAESALAAPRPLSIVLPRRVSPRMLALLNSGRDARYTAPDGRLDLARAAFAAAVSLLRAGLDARAATQALVASALRGPALARGPTGLLWLAGRVEAARVMLEKEAGRHAQHR